jgi:hypothetical protein
LRLLRQWFFDPVRLAHAVPDFDWRRHLHDYFCSGALFARRGVLNLDSYGETLDWAHRNRGLFGPGEMGLLNFLIFRAADQGQLRVGQEERLQTLACRHSRQELCQRFPLAALCDERVPVEPTVLHWSGRPKPTLAGLEVYSDPMTWFRARCLRDVHGRRVRAIRLRLRWQELQAAWKGARHAARQRRSG